MIAIIYFSRSGENFVNGEVKDLGTGNTKILAKKISERIGGLLIEIIPKTNYPNSYYETLKVVEMEKKNKHIPKYTNIKVDLSDVEAIFIGYPNWFGSMPSIVKKFLEELNLTGKMIYPFCTHEGSGFGNSLCELKKCCRGATIFDGLPVRGSKVTNADNAINNWLS